MKAYRYKDNVLVEVSYQGYGFREPIRAERFEATLAVYERCVAVGIVALDIEREERRSGIPTWFRPKLSRRKRCVAWAKTPASTRASMKPRALPDLQVREMRGHRVVFKDGTEAVLYLDALEHPTEAHVEDMNRAKDGLGTITLDDVRRLVPPYLWQRVPEATLEHEIGLVRFAFRGATGGVSRMKPWEVAEAARVVEGRLRQLMGVSFL